MTLDFSSMSFDTTNAGTCRKTRLQINLSLQGKWGIDFTPVSFSYVFRAPSDKHGVSVDLAHNACSVVYRLIAISYGKNGLSMLDSYILQNMGFSFVFQVPAEQEQSRYPIYGY